MFFSQEGCFPTTKNSDDDKECTCDIVRRPKKGIEEIIADKQLKEIFKKELKKDIFKLCQEYGTIYRDKSRGSSKSDAGGLKKKDHFLPPLVKRSAGSALSGEGYGYEDVDVDVDYIDWDKYRRRSKSMRRSRGSRASSCSGIRFMQKGFEDYDDDGRGRGRGTGWDGDSRDRGDGGLEGRDRIIGISSTDTSSDLSSMYEYGEYGEDFQMMPLSTSEGNLWEQRTHYLMKYYQLKKIAEKLDHRRSSSKVVWKKRIVTPKLKPDKEKEIVEDKEEDKDEIEATDDYDAGYKYGFSEGHKRAYHESPIYDKPEFKKYLEEFQPEVYEDMEDEEHPESTDVVYNCYALTKENQHENKTIYISTKPEKVEELKEIYKDVEIKLVRERKFSAETERIIAKKIDDFIQCYKTTELTDKTDTFVKGFIDGFTDGFDQTYIFQPSNEAFNDDEKLYVNEVRKCILFNEDDKHHDTKALRARAENLKLAFKDIIDFDAYEQEIKLLKLSKALNFTKSDFQFFYAFRNLRRKFSKAKEGRKHSGSKRHRKLKTAKSTSSEDLTIIKRKGKSSNDRAWDYMGRHRIEDIFRYMGTMLCAYKPDDPIDFLINLLDKCLLFRNNEVRNKAPLVFTEKHVESIYSNMDPLNMGFIDGKQYLYGLNLLEVTEADDILLVQNTNSVEKNQFLINANDRLLEKFRTMIAIA